MSRTHLLSHGFTTLPSIVPSSARSTLLQNFPSFFQSFPTSNYPDEWHFRPGFTYPHVTREICNGWKTNPLISAVVLNPNIGKGICKMMGSYISYNFVPYNSNSCTLWIALDDSGPQNGGLTYASGSHNWSSYDIDPNSGARVNRASPGTTFMSEGAFTAPLHEALSLHNAATHDDNISYDDVSFSTPSVPAGSALLHLQDTWHGSAPNESTTLERRAIAVHFIEEHSKFRPPVKNKSTPWGDANYIYGRYKRYGSDEVDGSFLPCTWGSKVEVWIDEYISESEIDHTTIGVEWADNIIED